MHFLLFLDSKNVVSIVSDLEVEALSTAMANQLKFEVCFHLAIFGYAYLYWLLVLSLALTVTVFFSNMETCRWEMRRTMRY
jgi:hypothetical protein